MRRLALALALLPAAAGAVDLSSVPIHMLLNELVDRGLEQWGCPGSGEPMQVDWESPSEGSPAVYYTYEITFRALTTDTTVVVPMPAAVDSAWCRVAGVDSLGRRGEWSEMGWWCP